MSDLAPDLEPDLAPDPDPGCDPGSEAAPGRPLLLRDVDDDIAYYGVLDEVAADRGDA